MFYKHFNKVPKDQWRWKYFTPRELASKGEGELRVDVGSLDKLEALRELVGKPLVLNSAYRSAAHNKTVGGAKASQHLLGKAYDIDMAGHNPHEIILLARKAGFTGIGTYPKKNFLHVDTGPSRSWGDPFPSAPKTPPIIPPAPVPPRDPKTPMGNLLMADFAKLLAVAGFLFLAYLFLK